MNDHLTLIASICASLAAIAGAKPLWTYCSTLTATIARRKKRVLYIQLVQNLREIRQKMQDMTSIMGVDKVAVLSGHNCGGLPRIGAPYHITPMHTERRAGNSFELSEDSVSIPADLAYTSLLVDIYKETMVRFDVKKSESCQLKRYLEVSGMTDAVLYYMDISDNDFIFLMVTTSNEAGFSQNTLNAIEFQAYAIRNSVVESNKLTAR